ncbi:site-specific integrase [Chryseobacterium indologenes]|uniref:site-specific integrase n=1 Tax=Chryseobacterium indologenes TaxID=253 RepID=UPI00076E4999|nr:site-specific integrase [Chryseobacterium indologenes]TLX24047.1 site-specific integrase [Chryseobacterium indologenes]
MPEAKFILKEPNSTKKTLVYLFYNFNNQRLKFSTGEKIEPKFWNPAKQRVKETSQFPEYPEFNQRLKNIETAVNNCYRRLKNDGIAITETILREKLREELAEDKPTVKQEDLVKWIEQEIEIIKSSQKKGSIEVYNALLKHLTDFSVKRKYKLTFDSITLDFYEQFKDYILNEKKLLTNTFGKQIKTLKTFLNIATEKGVNNNTVYKSRLFKAPEEKIDHIYLTLDELEILRQKDLSQIPYLDRVRDVFLIGCHTGLRFSDFTQLKRENLEKRKNGFVFNVITKKTKERVIIPVKPVVMEIWNKYDGELPRAISNQKMNDYLKVLGEVVEIDQPTIIKRTSGKEVREQIQPKFKLITTHTARRSFATNAYLSDVPAISIMKFTGHRTEASFMKYIKVSQERNADLLSSHKFFN